MTEYADATGNSTVVVENLYANLEVTDTEETGCQAKFTSGDIKGVGEMAPNSTHTNSDEIISLRTLSKQG